MVKEKIYEYLESKGVKPTQVERDLNWSKGGLTKASSITVDRLREFLLLYSDLSAEWLLRDKGDMILDFCDDELLHRQQNDVDRLKAEINQLIGENRILREQVGLSERKPSTKSA